MDFNKLRDRAYKTACKHGWHDEELSNEHWLMLIITEVSEAVQADRKELKADVDKFKKFSDDSFVMAFDMYVKNTVEDELADIVIRCLDLAGLRNIDLVAVDEDPFGNDVTSFTEYCYMICNFLLNYALDLNWKMMFVISFVVGYCARKCINIEWFIEQKMRFNELRSYKHGGKKY